VIDFLVLAAASYVISKSRKATQAARPPLLGPPLWPVVPAVPPIPVMAPPVMPEPYEPPEPPASYSDQTDPTPVEWASVAVDATRLDPDPDPDPELSIDTLVGPMAEVTVRYSIPTSAAELPPEPEDERRQCPRWLRGTGIASAVGALVLLGATVVLVMQPDPVVTVTQESAASSSEAPAPPEALWRPTEKPSPTTSTSPAPDPLLLQQPNDIHRESAAHRFLMAYKSIIHPTQPAREWAPAALELGHEQCVKLNRGESKYRAAEEMTRDYSGLSMFQAEEIIGAARDSFCPGEG
jgi:hypothetical protein